MVRDPQLAAANLGILLLVAFAVLVPLAWPKDPYGIDVLGSLAAPSWEHPMGTDDVGRDLLARFAMGARISLIVGVAVTVAAGIVGSVLGLLAGYFGGWIDAVISRTMDAILAFPPIIFAMAVTIGLGTGLVTASIGIAIAAVPWYARLVRADALRIRGLPFVEAASALGAGNRRILTMHVAPQAVTTLLIQSAAVFGYAILTLAGLGFIGLGAQIPTPEWGTMITEGLAYALTGQWWLGVFPGVGILVAVTAANMIADRARDLLDPHGELATDSGGA